MAEELTVDQMSEMILKDAKTATNPKRPEKIKLNVPSETMKKMMVSQGVDKDSLNNLSDAFVNVSRAMHHATSKKLREEILNNKADKEFLSKCSASTRGEILPKHIRLSVSVDGERRGMTVPREGHPSTEYVSYGSSKALIEINTPINEQREKDAEEIKKTYEEISK